MRSGSLVLAVALLASVVAAQEKKVLTEEGVDAVLAKQPAGAPGYGSDLYKVVAIARALLAEKIPQEKLKAADDKTKKALDAACVALEKTAPKSKLAAGAAGCVKLCEERANAEWKLFEAKSKLRTAEEKLALFRHGTPDYQTAEREVDDARMAKNRAEDEKIEKGRAHADNRRRLQDDRDALAKDAAAKGGGDDAKLDKAYSDFWHALDARYEILELRARKLHGVRELVEWQFKESEVALVKERLAKARAHAKHGLSPEAAKLLDEK